MEPTAPPTLASLPPEILHPILTSFGAPDLAHLYKLRFLNKEIGAASTRALVSELHRLLVIEKDVTRWFQHFVEAVRATGEGRLEPLSLGRLLRAAKLSPDSFVTVSVLDYLWEIGCGGDARHLGLFLVGLNASPREAIGALCAFGRAYEEGLPMRQLYRAISVFDAPEDELIRGILSSVLVANADFFSLIAALEGLLDFKLPDSTFEDTRYLPCDLVNPERAIPVLMAYIVSEVRRRNTTDLQRMIRLIANKLFTWGNHKLVGRTIGSCLSLSWEEKVALVRQMGRLYQDDKREWMVSFLSGLFQSTGRPSSDLHTRELFVALPPKTREAILAALFDESNYPAECTPHPSLALAKGDVDFTLLCKMLFRRGGDWYLGPLPERLRANDFMRLVTRLEIQVEDIASILPDLLRSMFLVPMGSAILDLAKSLIEAVGAANAIMGAIPLMSKYETSSAVTSSHLGHSIHILDYLLSRLDPESLASVVVKAYQTSDRTNTDFSTGLLLHWHLNAATYPPTLSEYAPAGAFLASSEFLARFMLAAHRALSDADFRLLDSKRPVSELNANQLFHALGRLLDLFQGDRLALYSAICTPPVLDLFDNEAAGVRFYYACLKEGKLPAFY